MNIRTTKECQLFVLVLNTFGRAEDGRVVAVSDDYNKLVNWYSQQIVDKPYNDGGFHKVFKKGSPIEFNNPCGSLELNKTYPFGHGIHDEWVKLEELDNVKSRYNFI